MNWVKESLQSIGIDAVWAALLVQSVLHRASSLPVAVKYIFEDAFASPTIALAYETPSEKIKKACKIVEEVISSHEKTRIDRAHFIELGATSLNFKVEYWVKSPHFGLRAYRAQRAASDAAKVKIHKELQNECQS